MTNDCDRLKVVRELGYRPSTRFLALLPFYSLAGVTLLSQSAEAVGVVALPWLTLILTGSASWVGGVAASALLSRIFGAVLGGVVVDRYGARSTSIAATLVSSAAVIAIAMLLWTNRLDIWALLILVFISEFFAVSASTAWESRLPEIARLTRLPLERVNAIQEIIESTLLMLGPLVAGYVSTVFGIKYTVALVAAFLLAYAITNIVAMPRSRRIVSTSDRSGFSYVLESIRRVLADRPMRFVLLITTILLSLLIACIEVALPAHFFATSGAVFELGLFVGFVGAGGIIGAVVYAVCGHRIPLRTFLVVGSAGFVAGVTLMALWPTLPWILVAALIIGIGGGPLEPLINTLVQRRAPIALRGRLMGTTLALALIVSPVTVIAVGAFYELFGAQMTMFGLAFVLATVAVIALFSPVLRAVETTTNIRTTHVATET